jgi:hypothetical protein
LTDKKLSLVLDQRNNAIGQQLRLSTDDGVVLKSVVIGFRNRILQASDK